MPGSTAAINTGGKKHSLQGRNKAEQNCRRTQEVPHIKRKLHQLVWGSFLFMPVVGGEPTRVISTRDFEF